MFNTKNCAACSHNLVRRRRKSRFHQPHVIRGSEEPKPNFLMGIIHENLRLLL